MKEMNSITHVNEVLLGLGEALGVPEQLVEGLLHVVHPAHVPLERRLHLPQRRLAGHLEVRVVVPATRVSFSTINLG